jgi:hypothetical protein
MSNDLLVASIRWTRKLVTLSARLERMAEGLGRPDNERALTAINSADL